MSKGRKNLLYRAISLSLALVLMCFTIAAASPGDLDATFSGDGLQTTNFTGSWNDAIWDIALQPDGKIVAVGTRFYQDNWATSQNFAIARYNINGALDATFSSDGRQLTDFGGVDAARAVAIQTDGKIVAGGEKCTLTFGCILALARYNPNGSLDTTFNWTGKKVVSFGTATNASFAGLAIQADGKIVAAGSISTGSNTDFSVYRLNANGSLDTTFSGDGKVSIGFGTGRNDLAGRLVLQGTKIVVEGDTCDSAFKNCNWAIARLKSDGGLDTTFSGDGKQVTDFGGDDHAMGIALQSNGKIVVVGGKYAADWSTASMALARYNANGSLDTTFNATGKKVVSFGTFAVGEDVVVQGDGKIAAAGYLSNSTQSNFVMARMYSGGSLDTTFSGDGRVTIDFDSARNWAYTMARQTDGKYVLGGDVLDPSGPAMNQMNFALARVLP